MSLWSWLWPFGHKAKPEIAHTVEPGKSFSFGTNVGSPATGQKLPPEHHRYIRRDTKPVSVPYRSHDTNDNSATVAAAVVLTDPGSPIHHTPAYTPSHTPSYHDSGSHSSGSHSHCDTGGYSGGFDGGGGGGGGCDGGGGGH